MTKKLTIASLAVLFLGCVMLIVQTGWAFEQGNITMAVLSWVTVQLVAGVGILLAGHLGDLG